MLLNFRVLAQAILSAPRRVLFALVLYTSTVVNSVRFLWWDWRHLKSLNGPFTHMHATLDKVVEWLEWVTF